MNSRQRRNIRRYWKYKMVIKQSDPEYYLRAREWCEKNLGDIGYRWGNSIWNSEFCFRHKNDYVTFVLKWS